MTDAYFDELAERLRGGGVPDREVAGVVGDLAAHVAESGTDPRDEFGTPEEFAAMLAPPAGDESPDAELSAPPEMPARKYFWSGRFYLFVIAYAAFIAAVCAVWVVFAPEESRTSFLTGFVAGALVAAAVVAVRLWRARR